MQKKISEQNKILDDLIYRTEQMIEQNKEWENYRVNVSSKNGIPQYYIIYPDNSRTYVRNNNMENAKKIAQMRYAKNVHNVLIQLQHEMNNLKTNCGFHIITDVYDKMCEGRKRLVTPIILCDEEYIYKWKKKYEGNRNVFFDEGLYTTNSGEKVRSKSEKIIADMFFQYGIPYQYEPMIILKGNKRCFPDFAVLNINNRKTYLWEHLGMITDSDYAIRNMEKIYSYEASGYELGKNLIVSMEADSLPLNIKVIENKIKEFLL